MSDSICINGQNIKLQQRVTGAGSISLIGYAFHLSQPESAILTTQIKVSEEDKLDFLNEFQSAQLWVNSSINCIGELMTDLKYEEADSNVLRNVGYLVTGLTELQALIQETREMVSISTKNEGLS